MMFPLGRVVVTKACLEHMNQAGLDPAYYITSHSLGVWGDLGCQDRVMNFKAVKEGTGRILSRHKLPTGESVYIITESDRSVTTLCLVSDY